MPRRIFLPVYGLAVILTIVAADFWARSGRGIAELIGLISGAAIIWIISIWLVRKSR
jgi:hypothetical protein